ncbi:MAG TPA: TIGR01548 family HAD-type hydrolase [Terriglobales bacterium]|nr:TIGR01548 family HAD-type hydrolase [Terriglobales bacterium]
MKVREAVLRMQPYHPPLEGRRGLRLDFNENTVGCAPSALAALAAVGAEDLARYPEYGEAEAEIARAFGHPPETLIVTNGVDDAIALAVTALLEPGDEAVMVEPTYAMYRFYCEAAGARLKPLRYADDGRRFALDLGSLRAAIGPRTRLMFLANPNNPTGSHTAAAELLECIASAPDCAFFVDEAYADFLGDGEPTLMARAGSPPNLLVARTFSKLYGLAGLRLGVLAAHADLVKMLRKVHSPYAVNSLALACGRAALADRAWAENYRRQIWASRARLEQVLTELGLRWWRSAANFVLFEAGERTDELLAAAREEGVLLRDRRRDVPGTVRVTCGTSEQTERVVALLRRIWRRVDERPGTGGAERGEPAVNRRDASSGGGAGAERPVLAFDLDGVLVDVSRSYRRAIAATVRHLGGGEVAPDEIQALKDAGGFNNDWDLTAELLRRRGRDLAYETVVAVFDAFYRGAGEDDGLRREERWLLPAAELARLAARYRLAIFTGRPRADAAWTLARFGVAHWFDWVIALEDVRRGKPDAEGLAAIARRAGAAGVLAYCGDTVDDAMCARAANVPFVGVIVPGHADAERLRRRFRELGCQAAAADVGAALRLLPALEGIWG